MTTLEEQFDQAAVIARQRRQAAPLAQASVALQRLDALYEAATVGEPGGREAAMRQHIGRVGDLGQQDGRARARRHGGMLQVRRPPDRHR